MKILTGPDRRLVEQLATEAVRAATEAVHLREAVETLRAEVARLHRAWERERQRADTAVDQLLALRGIPPVTPVQGPPVTVENPMAEDPEEVARIEREMQQRGFGAVLGGRS